MSALTDIPVAVGSSLGIGDVETAAFVGGLILSAAFILSIVLAMSYASRGRSKNLIGEIVVVFTIMGILTAIAWLPVWVMVVGVLAVVGLFSGALADMVRR